jgi:hypothetical protein
VNPDSRPDSPRWDDYPSVRCCESRKPAVRPSATMSAGFDPRGTVRAPVPFDERQT